MTQPVMTSWSSLSPAGFVWADAELAVTKRAAETTQ
jgi:hypothetical protein